MAHPLSLLFRVGSTIRSFLIPAVLIVVFSRGSRMEFWLAIWILPALVTAAMEYLGFRYRLDPEELVTRRVLLFRSERHIPYTRIQNIDLVQNPFHRMFGVAEVRIETASGSEPEAHIKVLSLEAVEEIRGRVFANRVETATAPAGTDVETAPSEELLRLPLREIVILGLVSHRGLAMIAAGLAFLSQFDIIERMLERAERITQTVSGFSWESIGLVGWVFLALVGLAVLETLSVGWAVAFAYDFRLNRHGEDLRTVRGLFTRATATVPRRRVQIVTVSQSLLQRLFRRVTVTLATAGGVVRDGVARHWLAPLLPDSDVARVLRVAQPDLDVEAAEFKPVAPRAWLRMFRLRLVGLALLTTPAVYWFGWWVLVPFLVLGGIALVDSRLSAARMGWALLPHGIVYREGWLSRKQSLTRFSRIQAVSMMQTPFDRRHRMASVRVDTAGGGRSGHRISISFLPEEVALELFRLIAWEAEEREFSW